MNRMFPALALLLSAATLSACGKREEPPLAGAKIGGPFALTDQNGKDWTNETIRGPKGALLVFVRSADW